MSNEITNIIWRLAGISPTTKLVLVSLGDQADKNGRCWPSVRYTAERTGLSERSVQNSIALLIGMGLVTRELRHGRSSIITVHPERVALHGDVTHTPDTSPSGKSVTPSLHTVHPAHATATPITPIESSGNPQTAAQLAHSDYAKARPGPKSSRSKTYATWSQYAEAYHRRYNVWPVWNGKTAGQISHLIDRLGANEAPEVAAFYVEINDARILNSCHSLNELLARAEAYRTQWATGQQINATTARQIEESQANLNAAEFARRMILKGDDNDFL